MTQIPIDVWEVVATLTDPNPLIYTSWAHVCRDSRAVFFKDALWRKFSPEDSNGSDLARAFHSRISQWTPQLLDKYQRLYLEIEAALRWTDDAKFQLHTVPDIIEKRMDFTLHYSESIDYDLICICWLHIISPIWWSESVRNDPIHALAIRQRNPYFSRPEFIRCAARLYGPLLRYFPMNYLDDKEIVLLATEYTPTGFAFISSMKSELDTWREVTPFSSISQRLKRDPEVIEAFISRWPFLADQLPKTSEEDTCI